MNKKTIAVIFGGVSSEYGVSLQSAYSVLTNLSENEYNIIAVGITKDGDMLLYKGDYSALLSDTWHNSDTEPITVSLSRSKKGLLKIASGEIIEIDAVLPIMHGKNGEDGTIQGLFEFAGIKVIGCSCLASALCMDKDRAHKLVEKEGIEVPHSILIKPNFDKEKLISDCNALGYPLFVKPVRAGSSFGISKVQNVSELLPAIELAFRHDCEVVIEEEIKGFEVGCAVMGNDILTIGRVDEIELSSGFFDFEEKYTLKTSKIHVPARIPAEMEDKIRETAGRIYKILGCSGFARVDLFKTPDDRIVFNEVNTIPGFTTHSRFPTMMNKAGIPFDKVLSAIINSSLEE